jgi:hypothetical protein
VINHAAEVAGFHGRSAVEPVCVVLPVKHCPQVGRSSRDAVLQFAHGGSATRDRLCLSTFLSTSRRLAWPPLDNVVDDPAAGPVQDRRYRETGRHGRPTRAQGLVTP